MVVLNRLVHLCAAGTFPHCANRPQMWSFNYKKRHVLLTPASRPQSTVQADCAETLVVHQPQMKAL